MEKHDFAPVDLFLRERLEEFELRSSGGGDHVSGAAYVDRLIYDRRCISGSGLAKLKLRVEKFYLQLLCLPYPTVCHCRLIADLSTASSTR